MKCVLLSITTNGLRSISKNITLKFYPYTAIDELNMDKKILKVFMAQMVLVNHQL